MDADRRAERPSVSVHWMSTTPLPSPLPPIVGMKQMQRQNYIAGQWVAGTGKQAELVDASTGELVATTSSGGLDFGAMLTYARKVGGPPLRKMTFPERACQSAA